MCSLQRVFWSLSEVRGAVWLGPSIGSLRGLIYPLLSQAMNRNIYISPREACDVNTSISPPPLGDFLSVRLWRSIRRPYCPHTLWALVSQSRWTQEHRCPQHIQWKIISSKALGLKVATLGFRSGFLVAVPAQSGEAGWRFGPGCLGSTIIGLGCVSGWEETTGRRNKEPQTLNEHLVKFITKFIIQTNHWCCIWRIKCIISLLPEDFFLEYLTLVKTANGEAFMNQIKWISIIVH